MFNSVFCSIFCCCLAFWFDKNYVNSGFDDHAIHINLQQQRQQKNQSEKWNKNKKNYFVVKFRAIPLSNFVCDGLMASWNYLHLCYFYYHKNGLNVVLSTLNLNTLWVMIQNKNQLEQDNVNKKQEEEDDKMME